MKLFELLFCSWLASLTKSIGLTNCNQIFSWYEKAPYSSTWEEKTELYKPKQLSSLEKALLEISYKKPHKDLNKLVKFEYEKGELNLKVRRFLSKDVEIIDGLREYYGNNLVRGSKSFPNMVDCWELKDGIIFGYERFDKTLEEQNVNKFSKEKKVSIASQLKEALADLQTRNVVHGDLAPRNIGCVDSNCNKILIVSFGNISRDQQALARGEAGYMPPEIFNQEKGVLQLKSLDIWSFGALILYLIDPETMNMFKTDEASSFNEDTKRKFFKVVASKTSKLKKGPRDFLQGLLNVDPKKRLNINQVQEMFDNIKYELF